MKQRAQFYAAIGFALGFILVFWIGWTLSLNLNEARGFRLPAGDATVGAVTFVEVGCSNCHSVYGVSEVQLGGQVRMVKSYGELVTAIIHPSETIREEVGKRYVDMEGNSLMPDLTKQMTTRELIDLVSFLEAHYEVMLPEYPSNYHYPYGGGTVP
jgi:hypothetical protein